MNKPAQPLAAFLVVLLVPVCANAQLSRGDWELTLAGTGATRSSGETAIGVQAGVGYFLTNQIELSLRQQVVWTDIETAGAFQGQTKLAADWNFTLGRFQPFIGGEGAFQYGDLISDSLEAGPEAGVRYFVNPTTFIYLKAEYEFFFRTGRSGDTSDDDQFNYTLGLGVRF